MPTLDCRVALACTTNNLDSLIQNGYAYTLIDSQYLKTIEHKVHTDILIIEDQHVHQIINLRSQIDYKFCLWIYTDQENKIAIDIYNKLVPNLIIHQTELSAELIYSELEKIDLEKQNQAKNKLTTELIDIDQQTKNQLKQQIFQDQQELIDRRQKILEVNNRIESLRKILFSLSEENDIARIETILNELLPQATAATWIKIIPQHLADNFESDLKLQLPHVFVKKSCLNYFVYFIKGNNRSFRSSDNEMFSKVSDALHFNLSRAHALERLAQLEKIVSTAFNSTAYPLLVVDKDYNILESNKAFHRFPAQKNQSALKCYQVMFNNDQPCKDCRFGQNFQIQHTDQNKINYFNVKSQRISDYEGQQSHWVHFYVDITEDKILEQRLSQTAKMKELGLISSSIAHELNNPLGGIISYIQILQMELAKDHPLQSDLKDMNQAALRMKQIIENLLVFSRRPSPQEKENMLIKDVLSEAIKMNELAFKVENIKVVHQLESCQEKLEMSPSNFRDSLNLIFSFFIEGLRRLRLHKNAQTGLVEVKFSQDQINSYLDLQSNIGPLNIEQKNKNIYFLVIHKSLIDQGFQVELSEPNLSWVSIRIAWPK